MGRHRKTGQVAKDGALRAVGQERGGVAGHDGRGADALEGALHGAAMDGPLEGLDGGGAHGSRTDTAAASTASVASTVAGHHHRWATAAIITAAIIIAGIDAITNTASVVTAISIAVR